MAVVGPVAGAQPPTEGLVGFWPFSGGSLDLSGNGNDATLLGKSQATYLLSLGDNNTDALSIPSDAVEGLGDFTFSAWVRISTLHTDQSGSGNTLITGASAIAPKAFVLMYHPTTGEWRIRMTGTKIDSFDRSIEDGGWHHVAVTRTNNLVRMFIDGGLIGSGRVLPTDQLDIDEGGFIVGQNQGSVGGDFEEQLSWAGAVDNLRMYDRSIGLVEIGALYDEGYSHPGYSVSVAVDSPFVRAEGDFVLYHLIITNETAEKQFAQYWTRQINPDGTELIGPFGQGEIEVEPFESITRRSSGTFTETDQPGVYVLNCFVGVNGIDTLSSGESTFQKLAVPCSDIDIFRVRCESGGKLYVQALMTGTPEYGGEQMFFDVNGVVYPVTIQSSLEDSKAILQLTGLSGGPHSVSIFPEGCYSPVVLQCSSSPGELSGMSDPAALTLADDQSGLPVRTSLVGAYPNPFNPTTNFEFELAEPMEVSIRVYDLLGREVAAPANGPFGSGSHTIQWHASGYPSGLYIYRFTSGGHAVTNRILLLK